MLVGQLLTVSNDKPYMAIRHNKQINPDCMFVSSFLRISIIIFPHHRENNDDIMQKQIDIVLLIKNIMCMTFI